MKTPQTDSRESQAVAVAVQNAYHIEHNSDDSHKIIHASGPIYERGRTTAAMGDSIDVPFRPGDYTGNGAMTWTVGATNIVNSSYALVGPRMFLDLALSSSSVGGATSPLFTLIAKAAAGSSNTNTATSGAINTTNADLLIASVADFGAGAASVVTDSKGNVWHALTTRQTGAVSRMRLWWSTPTTVGSGHTATATSTGEFPSIDLRAYSGSNIAGPFDVENGASSASAGTLQPGSLTPSQDNSLIVTGAAINADGGTPSSINASFINLDTVLVTANAEGLGCADIIQTSLAAVNPTWTFGGTAPCAAAIAVFKPSGVASSRLQFKIPGGLFAARSAVNVCQIIDNGTSVPGLIFATKNSNLLQFGRLDGAAFSVSSSNSGIMGQISFETRTA